MIGAHFDSVPNTPGADDNAGAVAVMLAVAKTLGLRRDVMYVAFNAEECDLAGSLEFVKEMAGEMKRLEEESRRTGASLAELVRRAIDNTYPEKAKAKAAAR